MAEFINPDDYDASIHREILDSIIRQDEAVLEICEDQAIAQMKSYLGSRYDCEKIFSARGKDRNALILMFAIDITLYHVCSILKSSLLSARNATRGLSNGLRWSAEWNSA